MLSKRLKILHVYEKGLQNCCDLKTGAISSTCLEIYPQKPTTRGYVNFLENCICGDKNISDLDYGGDNLSHPYTHVFGKIFVAASLLKRNFLFVQLNVYFAEYFLFANNF